MRVRFHHPGWVLVAFAALAPIWTSGFDHKLRASDVAVGSGVQSIAAAGDVDGDGFNDVIIGVPGDGDAVGAVYVYFGDDSASGINGTRKDRIVAPDGSAGDQFGFAVDGVGDVNGDGFADLWIGAPGHDQAADNAGASYLFLGSPAGVNLTSGVRHLADSPMADGGFGSSVAVVGNLNGDSWLDYAITEGSQVNVGLGTEFGTDWTTVVPLTSGVADDGFGTALTLTDVNNDGFDELVVGAPGSRVLHFFHGQPDFADAPLYETWHFTGGQPDDGFGSSLASGDVDNDGYNDVLVGAPLANDLGTQSGTVHLFFGTSTGLDETNVLTLLAGDGDPDDHFGDKVVITNVNDDLHDDVLVGASGQDDNGENAGAVYLFLGVAEEAPTTTQDTAEPFNPDPWEPTPTDPDPIQPPAERASEGCGCASGFRPGHGGWLLPLVLLFRRPRLLS